MKVLRLLPIFIRLYEKEKIFCRAYKQYIYINACLSVCLRMTDGTWLKNSKLQHDANLSNSA